jgi:drug/metabolite transporter (DMT)-like permease
MPPNQRQGLATLVLVALTAIWGSTFFLIRDVLRSVPPADFLAVRFTLAAIVLVAVAWPSVRALPRRAVILGVALGALYGTAQILQTVGLVTTPATVSGFVTGTYVVLTPCLSAVAFRERLTTATWAAVAVATAGLAVLSLRGLSIGLGEALTLGSALLYAGHIVGLGRYATAHRALALSAVQMMVIAVVTGLAAIPGGLTLPADLGAWAAVAYMAVVAGVVALLGQTWAQSHLSATRAAVIMTLEPVFAAAFAVWLGGEVVTARMWFGGLLVLAAMYLVELVPRTPADQTIEARHHEV